MLTIHTWQRRWHHCVCLSPESWPSVRPQSLHTEWCGPETERHTYKWTFEMIQSVLISNNLWNQITDHTAPHQFTTLISVSYMKVVFFLPAEETPDHHPPSLKVCVCWRQEPRRSTHSIWNKQTNKNKINELTEEFNQLNRSNISLRSHLSNILVVALSSFSRIWSSWASSSHRPPQPRTRARSFPVPRGSTPSWHCRKIQTNLFVLVLSAPMTWHL